jgi:hypothetical protein
MEIRERTPSTLRNYDGGPIGGGDGDPGAPTINAKKCRWRTPWEAVPEVQEHPPSTLEMSMPGPQEAMMEIREHPPSTQETSTKPPSPHGGGGPVSIQDLKGVL